MIIVKFELEIDVFQATSINLLEVIVEPIIKLKANKLRDAYIMAI